MFATMVGTHADGASPCGPFAWAQRRARLRTFEKAMTISTLRPAADRSLYRQFRSVFILILLFVMAAAIPALVLIDRSTGSGGAINLSGSLRMMSYKLSVAVSNPYVDEMVRRRSTMSAVEEFGRRLSDKGLAGEISKAEDNPIRMRYEQVVDRFERDIKPLAAESVGDESARRRFMEQIPSFVDEVDGFVTMLEKTLDARLARLQALLVITLLGGVAVTLVMLRIMRVRIFEPLKALEAMVEAVRRGDFSSRTSVERWRNEIGRLGRGFNFMVAELERLYGSLEEEVQRKTADLDRRNRGLELLAQSSVRLFSGGDLVPILTSVLSEAVEHLNAAGAAVVLERDGAARLLAAAPTPPAADAASLSFAIGEPGKPAAGRLLVAMCAGGEAPDWVKNFLTMLAGLIGSALAASIRVQDDRRLAVLEERSTIARELHDSIAQTLSFSRIQLLRLKRALSARGSDPETAAIAAELDTGVSTAYRQLREVLTAFRLQIHGSGWADAVNETVDAFRNRTGIPVEVANAVLGFDFSPNEQIHLMHILSEALANIEKHARASRVSIRVERLGEGGFSLTVADDGLGVPEQPERSKHFGLSIMRERAASLGAQMSVERLEPPGHGTVVRVWREKKTAERTEAV